MLKAAVIALIIVILVFTCAMCKAAGKADEKERKWIEQRKKEEKERLKCNIR